MAELLSILFLSVFANNYVLVKFLGLCPFMGVSQRLEIAFGMGMATTLVLTLSSALSFALYTYFLVPLDIPYLRTLVFIATIATIVGSIQIILQTAAPYLYQILGIYLPLITSNCAVLGVTLLNVRVADSTFIAAFYGLACALGFTFVLLVFTALREHVAAANTPAAFKGAPIGMLSAGILAIAFMGFAGIGS